MIRVLVLALLAGCSSILGIEDLSGPGSPVDGPGGPDVPVGNVLTFTLDVRIFDDAQMGDRPLVNAPVEFIRLPGRQRLDSGVTDPLGRVVLTLPTSGMPVDGYLLVQKGGGSIDYPETAFYPGPLVADGANGVVVLTDLALDQIAMQLGEPRTAASSFVFLFVAQPGTNGSMTGRAGIRIDTIAGERVIYDGPAGPDPNQQQTSDTGTAYIVNSVSMPHTVTAVEATTNRVVGGRDLDITTPRTTHYALIPTVP